MYFRDPFRSVTPPVQDGEMCCPINRMEEVVGCSDLLLYECDSIQWSSARCMSRFFRNPCGIGIVAHASLPILKGAGFVWVAAASQICCFVPPSDIRLSVKKSTKFPSLR